MIKLLDENERKELNILKNAQDALKKIGNSAGKIIMNGVSYTGNNISINNAGISVDGDIIDFPDSKNIDIQIFGNCNSVDTVNGNISVSGTAASVSNRNGTIEIGGDVIGDVSNRNGNIKAKNIQGNCTTRNGNISGR